MENTARWTPAVDALNEKHLDWKCRFSFTKTIGDHSYDMRLEDFDSYWQVSAIDRCEGSGGSHEQELRSLLKSAQGEEDGRSSESLEQMFEALASRLGLSDGGTDEGNDTEGGVA